MAEEKGRNIKETEGIVVIDNPYLVVATQIIMNDFDITNEEALSIISSNMDEILKPAFGMRILVQSYKNNQKVK